MCSLEPGQRCSYVKGGSTFGQNLQQDFPSVPGRRGNFRSEDFCKAKECCIGRYLGPIQDTHP